MTTGWKNTTELTVSHAACRNLKKNIPGLAL